ncbi:MAG: agmatinase [Desulfurococcaceae archaeon]
MSWRTLLLPRVFGCVSDELSPIAVVGVPLDATSTYRPGSRFAPARIREASCNLELYSLLAERSLEDIGYRDYGDLNIPPGDVERSLELVDYAVRSISREHEQLLVVLGGEHLVTYPTVLALKNKIDTLIVFDAHLDMRSEYLGSMLNHATFLRKLVEEGFKVVHIGSRAYSRDELEFAKNSKVELYNVLKVKKGDLDLGNLGRVYISIDLDVLDPSVAPGVSNPEPLGLSLEEFAKALIKVLSKTENLVAVDLVEVNPLVDHGDITSIVAAKIGLEIVGLYVEKMKSS